MTHKAGGVYGGRAPATKSILPTVPVALDSEDARHSAEMTAVRAKEQEWTSLSAFGNSLPRAETHRLRTDAQKADSAL